MICLNDEALTYMNSGTQVAARVHPDDSIFKRIEELLVKDAPCFFIVSPDINRQYVDRSLPKIMFVQPDLEFTFSIDCVDGEISYSRDAASEKCGGILLRDSLKRPMLHHCANLGDPMLFSDVSSGWVPAEEDESFLRRLDGAIALLQDFPAGKMTLTRAYEYEISEPHDPLALYEFHARQNGDYACSHFFCVQEGSSFSLGCSPENKFEIRDGRLVVDIVASTCRTSHNDEYLARELLNDPKQIKEHRLSINSRPKRFSAFCQEGSIRIVSEMKVKRLRNVCHLHSVAHGDLLPDISIFDLLESITFPVLGSNPKELIPLADTENEPHRYYGGLVGHSHAKQGGCFLNIRNALLKHNMIYAKVGVGLVAESRADSELQETKDKISGLMESVHLWRL